MSVSLRGFFKPFTDRLQSRLSRRIVLWVFAGIVTIEVIILIPSVQRRERELLSQLKELSSGKIAWILITYPGASGEELISHLTQLQQRNPEILGGAIYRSDADGQKVGTFGEPPELSLSEVNHSAQPHLLTRNGSRYDDVAWSGTQMQTNYTIIIRHDASNVRAELIAYIGRILGLVALISVFLTVTVWIALEPIVITPIFRLRRDLLMAGEAIYNDQEPPKFYSASIQRQDELGEVIAAFKQCFEQISEAISARKQAEAALKQSLETVEAYSQALDYELEKGHQMQKNFLPTQLLQKPGWEIGAFFKPARQVAGDFYDTFELPGGTVGLVIADICDKGVGAALFMGLFRSLIRIFSGQTNLDGLNCQDNKGSTHSGEASSVNLPQGELMVNSNESNPLKAVRLTHNYIAQNHSELGIFATLFFGVLDPVTGTLTYINGGHEPLLLIDSKGCLRESLNLTGPAVGMLPDPDFRIEQTHLEPGDTLLGYTDGVPEARAADGKFFTKKRLLSILEGTFSSTTDLLDQIAATVLEHIGTADQFDDITMLAVRRMS